MQQKHPFIVGGVELMLSLEEVDLLLLDLCRQRVQAAPRPIDLPRIGQDLPRIVGGNTVFLGPRPVDDGGRLLLFAPLFGWLQWDVPPQAVQELQAWAVGVDIAKPPNDQSH